MQKKVVANDIIVPEIARLVAEGTKVAFTPKGVSMLPFILGGRDSVVLMKAEDPRIGDIALARIGTSYVLHRIIGIEADVVTLMGDGNVAGTEKCSRADILAEQRRSGKTAAKLNAARRTTFAKRKYGERCCR